MAGLLDRVAEQPLSRAATGPLLIVCFRLTQQEPCRRIRPTFPGGCKEKVWGYRAVSSRLDCAVHQPGMRRARPVAPRGPVAIGVLLQLRRSVAPGATAAGAALAAAAPHAGDVPAVASTALGIWVALAALRRYQRNCSRQKSPRSGRPIVIKG
jgi:hypothetical protein